MPRTLLFRGRADRVIGWARIILAASSIAAVSLDPLLSGSRSTLATGVVGTYFLFAVIALPLGDWLRHPLLVRPWLPHAGSRRDHGGGVLDRGAGQPVLRPLQLS